MTSAAKLAIRGHGGAEPNPLVGCVIVDVRGDVVGWGYHRLCGSDHAEIAALGRAGDRARRATAYVTLEPCNHIGRTGPCTEALIDAGISRVVIARRDPNTVAAGGAQRLQQAGVHVSFLQDCESAMDISDPFVHRLRSGLPWITAKWAQTIDGRIATRTGDSKWISGVRSRRFAHRLRGRVDAVLTGVGTVLSDDPLLTARDGRVRRAARRIIVDPHLRSPLDSQIIQTSTDYSTMIICSETHAQPSDGKAAALRASGVELIGASSDDDRLSLGPVLRLLVSMHDISHVLVEAGTGLLSSLFEQRLINDAIVFIAPTLLGDDSAMPSVRGRHVDSIADGVTFDLRDVRRRDADVMLRYRVTY